MNERTETIGERALKAITTFLLIADKSFSHKSYTDDLERNGNAFEIEVEDYILTIICNEDGYIGFQIEEKDGVKGK